MLYKPYFLHIYCIGLEALIFNHDNLTMTSHYILPTLNLSSPGYFRPSFEIPSIVILNQSNPEGIDFLWYNVWLDQRLLAFLQN